jgi:trichodiene synthase
MAVPNFPTAHFCKSIVRSLDTIEYDDFNLMREERILALREVHSKTAEYFAQLLPRETLKDVHPARIATVCRTVLHLVVYFWPYVPHEVQVYVTIWQSIINVLDDELSADPAANTSTLLTDMLAGQPPRQPFWKLCCWIEQHSFQGWRRADCYPMFVRRLTTPGSGVAGSLLPASGGFDDQKLFKEMSIVMAHIDGIVALPNDLLLLQGVRPGRTKSSVQSMCR